MELFSQIYIGDVWLVSHSQTAIFALEYYQFLYKRLCARKRSGHMRLVLASLQYTFTCTFYQELIESYVGLNELLVLHIKICIVSSRKILLSV